MILNPLVFARMRISWQCAHKGVKAFWNSDVKNELPQSGA